MKPKPKPKLKSKGDNKIKVELFNFQLKMIRFCMEDEISSYRETIAMLRKNTGSGDVGELKSELRENMEFELGDLQDTLSEIENLITEDTETEETI